MRSEADPRCLNASREELRRVLEGGSPWTSTTCWPAASSCERRPVVKQVGSWYGEQTQHGLSFMHPLRRRQAESRLFMAQLPMIPGWDGIHPLLIHFPLSLFFLAPVFVLFASLTKATTRRTFLISALTVMFLGITLTYAAFAAGQAAAASVTRSEEVRTVVDRHQELAGLARSSLTAAILLFSLTLLLCTCFHLQPHELTGVLPLGSVLFYALGLFWLINTAYHGERLVHEFGVGSIVNP